uniref:Integrase catalytic domain-containing protein n=1 Tax=Arundo donax TaxID=35708 RepID=A0A0A9BSM5_ARUDO
MQCKAMTRLVGLQFKILYRKGKENSAADALSRVGHLMAIQTVSEAQPLWIQEVLNSYNTDPGTRQLAQLVIKSPDEHGYSLHQGVIRHGDQIWIGENSALRTKLIAALHDSVVGGHSGAQATYQRVKRSFHWRGLKQDVEEFVKQCGVCQQAKHERVHPAGLLQPLPIPVGVWQDITMDFIESLPKSEEVDVILVVVDRLSKYAHFIPLHHPFTAQQVARAVLDNVVKLHGMPKSMVSDRDKVFTSAFWCELFQLMDIKLHLSSAYHPQTDG